MDLIKLLADAPEASVPAGEWVFAEGQPGDVMYVVKSGRVEVAYDGRALESVGPGGVLGEMALVGRTIRSADAVAQSDCVLLAVDAARFVALVRAPPEFALAVMKAMADRLGRRTAEGG